MYIDMQLIFYSICIAVVEIFHAFSAILLLIIAIVSNRIDCSPFHLHSIQIVQSIQYNNSNNSIQQEMQLLPNTHIYCYCNCKCNCNNNNNSETMVITIPMTKHFSQNFNHRKRSVL